MRIDSTVLVSLVYVRWSTRSTYMFHSPQNNHAFQETCACAARAHEQIEECSRDRGGPFLAQYKTELGCCDLEELHLAAHVVEGGDEQIHGPIHGVELRVLRLRQSYLGKQLSHEAYIASSVVSILCQPLRQRPCSQRAAACMRQEGLLCGLCEGV